MSWRRAIIKGILWFSGYLGLLVLLWVLGFAVGIRVFPVLFWVCSAPLLLVLFIILVTLALAIIPVRYRVKANTGVGTEQAAFAKVNYLFGLIRGTYVYENGESKLKYYIAWFDLSKRRKASKAENFKEDSECQAPYSPEKSNFLKIFEKYVEPEHDDSGKRDEVKHPPPAAPKSKSKFSDKINNIKAKYAETKSKIDAVLTYPNRKIIMRLVFGTIKKFFKTLKPKHLDISGRIGFEDPSKTGLFMGLYEALADVLKIRNNVRLVSDFDTPTTVIDLKINAKGSISVARMTRPFIGLLIKKPIRTLIKDLLNFREEDSNE